MKPVGVVAGYSGANGVQQFALYTGAALCFCR